MLLSSYPLILEEDKPGMTAPFLIRPSRSDFFGIFKNFHIFRARIGPLDIFEMSQKKSDFFLLQWRLKSPKIGQNRKICQNREKSVFEFGHFWPCIAQYEIYDYLSTFFMVFRSLFTVFHF